jgi:carbon storage regulator CsrA
MLVLSRRENESVLFPNLDIEVRIIRVAGKIVRVGVNAPKHIRVLRGELADQASTPTRRSSAVVLDRHAIRNRLNNAMLGLQLLQASIETGDTEDLESSVHSIFQTLDELNHALDGDTPEADPAGAPRDAALPEADNQRYALIVDDSKNEASLLAQLLRLKGYTPHVVHNGREAIRWLEEHAQPDVVLMDMSMPEMDGPTAIREIRNDSRFDGVQLFGVSGMKPSEVGLPAGAGGIDHWFQKPVNANEIAREIDRRCPQPETPV